jgi:hypothetical protein
MFSKGKAWLLLAFVALLLGCQPVDSFNPLYRDKDVVFDPALLGKWTENGGMLEFNQLGQNAYEVVFTDENNPDEQMVLQGHLVSLEGHRFLDLIQKKWTANPDLYQVSIETGKNGGVTPRFLHAGDGAYIEFMPGGSAAKATRLGMQLRIAHWFFRLTNDQNTLGLDYIDDDRLNKALEQKTIQVDHLLIGTDRRPGETDNRQLVLTAATADLQKFVLEHVNDSQVFADSLKFTRIEKPNLTTDQH